MRKLYATFGTSILVAFGTIALGAGPGTDTLYPAIVTFSDRVGDAVTSDGRGSHFNGGKLETGFHTISNDLVMRGGGGSNPRCVNLDFRFLLSANGPIGTSEECTIFMNIHNILTLPLGQAKQTGANFATSITSGQFRFDASFSVSGVPATKVDVVRNLDGTWTISADTGTDTAALTKVKGTKETAIALYSMPFQITVSCPTCG